MSDSNEARSALLERPHRISPPRRTKFQLCLTAAERALLNEQARAAGYETVSAFVRARTLGQHEQEGSRLDARV